MKVLHIIRGVDEKTPLDIIEYEADRHDVTVLLIQDGVLYTDIKSSKYRIYASADDVMARGVDVPFRRVDYNRICDMIIENDKVVVW